MELKLEQSEAALLKQVLERFLGNLRMEIGKTENFGMRQELKADEEVVKAIIARL
ncbi:MAG: hypothetical protein HS107_07285 [Thermoflexaceae bacterium]|nr:hypothetical protein [Thermoflexaceae bacterium]